MLYENTVAPATLGLLKKLMQIEALKPFALVGGTNLSLRLGHRISEDLDIFAVEAYESDAIAQPLIDMFLDEITIVEQRTHTLLAYVRGVKIDLVLHRYPYIEPIEIIDGIRFASIPDIVAMKLNAVTRRGSKKDYFDLAELLNYYPLSTMLRFFSDKYTTTDIGFVVRSLVYFEEAERSKDPIMLTKINWHQVKEKIEKAVKEYWKT
jgi:predicted nucleotidyltransferase component of viral defense system